MTLSFNELYKEFRNRVRAFQPQSIVNAAMQTLRAPAPTPLDRIQRLPWQVTLIAKWALQDPVASDAHGAIVTVEQFDDLRRHLQQFPERLNTVGTGSFALTMRRLLHQQIAFQKKMSTGFTREAALLSALAPDHPLRVLFAGRTGLTPEEFIDLSFATYAAIVDDKLSLALNWFSSLESHYQTTSIESFIALVSRDYRELKVFCRALPGHEHRVLSEFFEFTPFHRFPFLRTGSHLECWGAMVFFRGMEGLVHSILSEAGSDYIQPFSRIFEDHVLSELRSLGQPVLGESELRALIGHDSKVPDALISFEDANVFVEAKAGLFDESVMVVGSADTLSHKTRALRTAITQGWAASTALRGNAASPERVRDAPIDYLLVVTNRGLNASNGVRLREMYPEGKLEYPSADCKERLPLERVYLLPVDDFERLVAGAKHEHLHIPDILATCVANDSRPETAKFLFEQHLSALRVPRRYSALVTDALDASEARLRAALSP